MHNIKHNLKLLKFTPLEEMPEEIAQFLEEYFEVVTVNYTDQGLEEYVCYASPSFDAADFEKQIKQQNIKLPPYQEEILEDKNWLTENVIKFSPFEIGEFLIYGIHETSTPKTDKIPVQVYAATAFGSEHQTTKMCLTAISELKRLVFPKKILDMGTGSGILSISASKLWNNTPQIIAADIDQESVDVTHSNTITNNVDNNIVSILSNGYENPLIKQTAPYDIIFANILLNPLKSMTADAFNSLKEGGYYLISGFIDNQLEDIINHHISHGFNHIKTYEIDNWRAVLLQK
jgi:ribosomal protein L11 methyltransferase